MICKVDFHTHSVASPDGALKAEHYKRMLEHGRLDCIAITDHNTIDFAKRLQTELGDQIIIGEEITTKEGEIIGLFLQEVVPAHLSAADTIEAIHDQGGLAYIPHPFETVRDAMTLHGLEHVAGKVDIIEIHNGRAVFQNFSSHAQVWAKQHGVPMAASSDAHGINGWGRTYTMLSAVPTRETLCTLLRDASFEVALPGMRGMMYPKFNRFRNKWRKNA